MTAQRGEILDIYPVKIRSKTDNFCAEQSNEGAQICAARFYEVDKVLGKRRGLILVFQVSVTARHQILQCVPDGAAR